MERAITNNFERSQRKELHIKEDLESPGEQKNSDSPI